MATPASATPAANTVVKALGTGKIAAGWLDTTTLFATIVDSAFFVIGNADATKRVAFQADTQGAGFTLTYDVGAQTASRVLSAPVLTADATLAALSEVQTFSGAKTFSAVLTISNTTASTSTTTGGLVVAAGVGVLGSMFVGGVFAVSGAASTYRNYGMFTDASQRWGFVTTNASETGAEAGSNLTFDRYLDNGAFAANWLRITRSTGDATFVSNLSGLGSITTSSPTLGIGYATGAGGTVTQATSKATGVTLNKVCGTITLNAAALAAATSVAFTLTNSAIAATDVLIVSLKSGATANSYFASIDAVASGSCSISLRNYTAGSLSEAVVLFFVVIKAVAA